MDSNTISLIATIAVTLLTGVNIVNLYQIKASKRKLEAETKQIAIAVSEKAVEIAGEVNQELRGELDRLQAKVEVLEAGDRAKGERIRILEDKILEDEDIISGLKEAIKSLTTENRVLRESLAAMSDERHAILERLDSVEAQNAQLVQENRKLRKQVAELRKKAE